MKLKEILLVDEKVPISSAISFILQSKGYLVMLAPNAETACENLDNYFFDLMLVYLTGYEKDKLDLLRQANRRSPQTKVMIVANPRKMTLPLEAFRVEVEDYLLMPFSTLELCRRVNHCLHQSKVFQPESVFEGRGGKINEQVLNSLRIKFGGIHNTLFSLKAHINILVQEGNGIRNKGKLCIDKISDDVMSMMNITEEFLYNHLACIDMNHQNKRELISGSYGG
jgi:DNA-binding response OmpR family regulator